MRRPGQLGPLLGGRVRPSDVGATIPDLAVRNYLWLTEAPDRSGVIDFQNSRRPPLDAAVDSYERAVVAAILPDNRPNVSVSELARGAVGDLSATRAAIDAGVAARGWLPARRNLLPAIGFGMLAVAVPAAAAGWSPD